MQPISLKEGALERVCSSAQRIYGNTAFLIGLLYVRFLSIRLLQIYLVFILNNTLVRSWELKEGVVGRPL